MSPDLTYTEVNQNLAARENASWFSPVRFAYDWLEDAPIEHLTAVPLKIRTDSPLASPKPSHVKEQSITENNENSFSISPQLTGLPWPTSFTKVRQNRHWRQSLRISTQLLELFAADDTSAQAVRRNGVSLARIASHELQTDEEDRFTKFATYIFPEANEERMKLLAATIVYIIIFDDSWEMHSEDTLGLVRDDFIRRLRGDIEGMAEHQTPLQQLINSTVQGFKDQDKTMGNGGQEVLDRLIDFCEHVPPQTKFATMGDYLSYRLIDVAFPYLLACIKFSLGSSVNVEDPKLARILRLVSDHVSLVNDLASYDKEKRAYDNGSACYLINAVDVAQRLFSLPSAAEAKALTYSMQLLVEAQIKTELDSLVAGGILSCEELRFLDAALLMASGNVFYSVVSSRYGGKAAKLEK